MPLNNTQIQALKDRLAMLQRSVSPHPKPPVRPEDSGWGSPPPPASPVQLAGWLSAALADLQCAADMDAIVEERKIPGQEIPSEALRQWLEYLNGAISEILSFLQGAFPQINY